MRAATRPTMRDVAARAGGRKTVSRVIDRETGVSQATIEVVGFDDFELADLLALPTTVIRHDASALGAEAAADAAPRHLVIETELVPRGSGEVQPRT